LATLNNSCLNKDACVFGIDFGSRYSGNTVICIFKNNNIFFLDVDENVDADAFIMNAANHFKPEKIFIDAPLSLPGIYTLKGSFSDYNFRCGDRELCAMSPMFLGGLTARAIKLKDELESMGIEVKETYPKVLATRFDLKSIGYKSSKIHLPKCRSAVTSRFGHDISINCADIKTWHHLDALLALMSALNYCCGRHETFGDEREGVIII
jgi:predicted nuclease with RNAse H fold